MSSDLKWKYGFDWGSVICFVVFGCGTLFLSGFFKGVSAVFFIFTLSFIVFQYRKWNSSDWRKLHFRGMLLFSQLLGLEMGAAETDGREASFKEVCRQLGIGLCGKDKEDSVNAMIEELYEENGSYCAQLIEKYCPDLPALSETLKLAKKIDFGPQLVICNIIENSFGGEEAVKYIEALISGDAH